MKSGSCLAPPPWSHSEPAGPGQQCLYVPGTQGQRGSYVLEPCRQGHWASSCSQACSGNWGGEICLPMGPPHAWESGTGGLRLGAQSREKGDGSAFPCLAQWCLLTLRSATLPRQGCVFPSRPAASRLPDLIPEELAAQTLLSLSVASDRSKAKPGLTHGFAGSRSIHPLTSIASGRGLGGSQGGEMEAVGEHLPSRCPPPPTQAESSLMSARPRWETGH